MDWTALASAGDKKDTQADAWAHSAYDTYQTDKFRKQDKKYATKMANTRYQREMADLKKAGLNPLLAAHSGAGVASASSPSFSTSAGSGGQNPGIAYATAEQIRSQTELNKNQKLVQNSQAALNSAKAQKELSQVPKEQIKGKLWGLPQTILDSIMNTAPEKIDWQQILQEQNKKRKSGQKKLKGFKPKWSFPKTKGGR